KPAISPELQCGPGAAPDPRCGLARKPDDKDKPEAVGSESWAIPAGPDESHFPWLTVVVSVITLSLLAFLAALRLPRFLREDSPNFQKALEVWADWLSERHTTPRSFKRFFNKVRFLAVLERGENAAVASWGARIRRLWSRRRTPPAGGEDLLSPAIVAYAAALTRQNHWRRELLLHAFAVDGSEPDTTALANVFDATRSKTFDAVYAELRETVQAHRAIDSFEAGDTANAWLPSPNIQKLIEQVMFPDGVEPLAQPSPQSASAAT
ncbi:MAG: hypothetical protein M0P19_12320, partial [Nevskia sp.]|nr:hypothetical protein [Nevskia sp.]